MGYELISGFSYIRTPNKIKGFSSLFIFKDFSENLSSGKVFIKLQIQFLYIDYSSIFILSCFPWCTLALLIV
jgi:hypothetical protein